MRKIALAKDEAGINRLLLNGKPLFQLGPLDQGWWPDGLYTAPTDEALDYDMEMTKQLGFNMIRKHVKVEPDRWYYWCDKLGMLVWQDMPAGDNRDDAAQSSSSPLELERMIDALRNHPSIVMWVPFNEGWGQHDTPRYVDWIKQHDPTRLVNNASGWTDTHRRRRRHAQLSRPRHAADRKATAPRCSASSAASACRSRAMSGSIRTTGATAPSSTREDADKRIPTS